MGLYEKMQAGWEAVWNAMADVRHKMEESVYGRQVTGDPIHSFYGSDHAPTFREYCAQHGTPGTGEPPGHSVSQAHEKGQDI